MKFNSKVEDLMNKLYTTGDDEISREDLIKDWKIIKMQNTKHLNY